MKTYHRIQYEDRCQIYAFWKAGTTEADIGNALGFSQGTVIRELFRNKGGYRFRLSQHKAQVRHKPRTLTRRREQRGRPSRRLRSRDTAPPPPDTLLIRRQVG